MDLEVKNFLKINSMFGKCIIDHFNISSKDKVNIYANSDYTTFSVLKVHENYKNEEKKLIQDEKMSLIFNNIHLLHSKNCPIQTLSSSLKDTSLELNYSSESNKSLSIKLASIGIVQDKQDYFLLTKRNKNLSIFPRVWVFPGGKLDKQENFIEACIREVKEEIGLEINYSNNKFHYRNNQVEIENLIAYESVYPDKLSLGIPRAQTLIIFFLIKINETKEKIDLSFEVNEVEAYAWIHKKDLNDILFTEKENFEFEGYVLNKKNQFEKKTMNSFNLSNNHGEGIPYGHFVAFKHYLAKYPFPSNH